LIRLRTIMLLGATKVPGGVIETRASGGRTEAEFASVPVAEQRAAVQFLMDNLEVPQAFLRPDIAYRLQAFDVMEPLESSQKAVLSDMLYGGVYRALTDLETTNPRNAYTVMQYLSDIRRGVWRELNQARPSVHPLRRALQRHHLDVIEAQMKAFDQGGDGSLESGTDFRAAARACLRDLLRDLGAAIPRAGDSMTRAHLQDARDQIERMLKP
jgi:hypothetical protein